jgi:hypothetical protein
MSSIDFNIAYLNDPEADHQVTSTLQDLINGVDDETTAAKTIDEIFVTDCHEAYNSYTIAI